MISQYITACDDDQSPCRRGGSGGRNVARTRNHRILGCVELSTAEDRNPAALIDLP